MTVQTMDPVVGVMSRLDQAFKQAEAGALATDAMTDVIDNAMEIVDPLIDQAIGQASIGDFNAAAKAWTNVADFTDRMASIMAFFIDRKQQETAGSEVADSEGSDSEVTDSEELDSEELTELIEEVARLTTMARGQALLATAINRRLWGTPAEAEASASEAKRLFESLAEDDEINTLILIAAADSQRLLAIASGEQLRFKYEDCAVSFLQAKKVLEKARDRLLQSDDTPTAALASIMADIYECTMAAERALLMKSLGDGDFEKAVTHADAMTRIAPPPDNANLPPFIRQSATMVRCNAMAYLAYAQAEVAANSRNWDEALRKLTEADKQWRELVAMSIDLDIPQARQVADNAQALSSQMTGSCRRRITRERSLYAQIAEVEAENQQLQNKIFQLAGKTTFSGGYMSGDEYKFGKVGQAGSIGSHNTISDIDMNQASVENALADVDMSALAEQLGSLIQQLKASANSPDEYTALAEVSQAEHAAREQDKAGTLQHLKKAGQWVLGIASTIGVPLAVSALKAALGLPQL